MRSILAQCGLPFQVIGLPAFPTLSLQGIDADLVPAVTTLYMQESARRVFSADPRISSATSTAKKISSAAWRF